VKTIDLTTGAPSLPDLLNLASEENVILRAADGREFVLAEVDDFEREVALVRQNQELMELLDRRSRPSKTYTIEEARNLLGIDRPE
jgi:hypothetical protein